MLAPALLADHHELDGFANGRHPSLDDWLKRRARANQASGASRTYVVAEGSRVIGYYCLAVGAMALADAPGKIRRNMPEPIPMAILGRLAVDQEFKGRKVGAAMLKDAVLRAGQAAEIVGIRGVLVHAIDEEAAGFYMHYGFQTSPSNPLTLVLSLKTP